MAVRTWITVVACLAFPAAAHAQVKPNAATLQAISGTWTFDQSRSDTIPSNPMQMLRARRAFTPPSTGGGGGGGGGGGRGGGRRGRGGGGGGGGGGADSTPVFGARSNAVDRSPAMAYVIIDMLPPATLQISATDTGVVLTSGNRTSTWNTDGKTHQEALMEGGMLESQAAWDGTALQLQRDIPNSATLTREFRVAKDGATLEVKETLKYNGQKVEKKLVFTRAQ